MPNYGSAIYQTAVALNPGDSNYFFNGESPTAPQASQEFALPPRPFTTGAAISVELTFSGVPGVFSFQIQEADTDTANDFITPASSAYTIESVNANNIARVDLIPTGGKFVRGYLASLANSVTVTAKITRIY